MLRTETISAATLVILNDLMADPRLLDFFLVGGTALSLQIGHRVSIDIDLFSITDFDENLLFEYLEVDKGMKLDYISKNTIKGQIGEVKVDFITHKYPSVKQKVIVDGIRMAHFTDIAAMKLNAIVGNGTRLKVFVDIAFLSSKLTLNEMIDAYEEKYSSRNPLITLKALAYHNDIDFKEPIKLINAPYDWKVFEKRLNQMVKFPAKIFPGVV